MLVNVCFNSLNKMNGNFKKKDFFCIPKNLFSYTPLYLYVGTTCIRMPSQVLASESKPCMGNKIFVSLFKDYGNKIWNKKKSNQASLKSLT